MVFCYNGLNKLNNQDFDGLKAIACTEPISIPRTAGGLVWNSGNSGASFTFHDSFENLLMPAL